MELYNRRGSRFETRKVCEIEVKTWETKRVWKRREVLGCHRNPGQHCNKSFDKRHDAFYCIDTANGRFDAPKLCVGCLGRLLYFHVENDRATILRELHQLRETHTQGNGVSPHTRVSSDSS